MKRLFIIIWLTFLLSYVSFLYAQQEEPILVIDPQGHSAMIRDVMFTPDGGTLISVSEDKTIRLWDVETGDWIKTIRGQIGIGLEGILNAGALSPDGKTLAVGGYLGNTGETVGNIRFFNIVSGEQIGVLKGHTNCIDALAFSSDGLFLASGSFDKTVRFWEVARQKEIAKLEGHTHAIYDVAFSPDGKKLVSASCDGTLRLWNVGQVDNLTYREMKKHTTEVYCVAFAPNGKYIVSGGKDDKILLWDGNGKFMKEIDTYSDDVGTISFSADSKKIVICGGRNYNAIVYSILSGEKITIFSKHNKTVVASAFYGSDLIATAGGDDNDIYIWDANSGTVKTHILGKGRTVMAVAFGEGLNVAFGNTWGIGQGNLEKSFNFYTMSLYPQPPNESDFFQRTRTNYAGKSLQKVEDFTLKITGGETIENDINADYYIHSYTFTPDGYIVVGSTYSLKLYRSDGAFIRNFIGHNGGVMAVSVELSSRILTSASSDQTIKLWNIQSGELLATLFVTSDNEWICWTPQGYYAASAGGERYIGWQINQGMDKAAEYYPVYAFRQQFYNPELVIRTIELASFQEALAEYNRKHGKKIEPEKITQVLPPEVTWLSPSDVYTKTNTNSILIQARVTSDAKITALKIQVNGGTIATTSQLRTVSNVGTFGKVIEYQVPLSPQKNEIRIYAENARTFTTSKELIVFYESLDWMKPNLYMVSIGISDYQHDKILNYADDDAFAIIQVFENQGGLLFNKINIKKLCNSDATYGNIIDALEWLDENATQKDVVVVFIAAHGYKEKENYYILPVEGDPNNLRRTAVDWREYKDILGNLPCKVLLFLDTCYSGQLAMDLFTARGDGKSRIDNTEAIRELTSEEYGVVIMAASTGTEISQEHPKWGHSAFTKALIGGLKDGKADISGDGIIHLQELDFYVTEQVKELTEGKQHSKTNYSPGITISRFPIYQLE